jgi:hypothetical protein
MKNGFELILEKCYFSLKKHEKTLKLTLGMFIFKFDLIFGFLGSKEV